MPSIFGHVAPGFEEVQIEFQRNFTERGEIGAAVAAYWQGTKVVDLWGGRRVPDGAALWQENTLVCMMSGTKGMAAMAFAVANARGWLDYESPIAEYWPEFAQNGKEAITVRQLLAHQAGLVVLDETLTIEMMRDLDQVSRLLARQKPAWLPGTRHGYHTLSLGLYMQEIIRHVDPQCRTLGRFFDDEIAKPLGLEFYIGLPSEIPDARLAKVKMLSVWRMMLGLHKPPAGMLLKLFWPRSILLRSLLFSDLNWNDRRLFEVELPAGNGMGTPRAMAKAYSVFAEGGSELGITAETFQRIIAVPDAVHPIDQVLGVETFFALGFWRSNPAARMGANPRVFGSPGAGGSFAFADPDARLGYSYAMNKFDLYLYDDPREKSLRDAVYRAIRSA